MWEIKLFGTTTVNAGGLTVSSGHLGGERPRQILEILALSAGVPVAKDHLAEMLWDGQPPPSYLGSLESYVCVLRRSLGLGRGRSSVLHTVTRGYVLETEHVTVDLREFRRLVREAANGADPRTCLHRLQQALSLADEQLLAADTYAPWAVTEREGFRRELVDAATAAATHAAALGMHDNAVALSQRAIDADPLAETAWCLLMRALWRAGRGAEALRAYLTLKEHLAAELGTDPSAASRQLYVEILRADDGDDRHGAYDAREEVRVLMQLLREAICAVPGVPAPRTDSALIRVAAQLVA